MGCSAPSWWYEEQNRASLARSQREHQEKVRELVNLIKTMTDEERAQVWDAIGTNPHGPLIGANDE